MNSIQNKNERARLRNVAREVKEKLSKMDHFALWITEHVGTIGFFLLVAIWTISWLSWNMLAPQHLQFDPPMGFILWLFISNVLQILLMPLIMVGQNYQGIHAAARAQHEYEINVLAEKEIEMILTQLDKQSKELQEIKTLLGR